VDPDDGMTLWTIQEYVAANDVWGTRVAKLRAPAPPAPSGAAGPATLGVASTNLTISGAPTNGVGYFEPGSGFSKHLQADIGNCGIVVNGVTNVAPGTVSLDVDTTGVIEGAACNVTITNPDGQSATTNALFTPSGNHVPAANPDGPFQLTCCGPFNGPSVLANDSDRDGNPLTAVKVTDPGHGTLALAAGGTFTYTPAAGFSGNDSFSYAVSDGQVQSAPAAVTLTVAPAASSGGGGGTNTATGTTSAPAPPAPTGASTSPTVFTVSLALVPAKLRAVLAKGLRVSTGCGQSCSLTVKLTLSAGDAKRLHLGRTIATVRRSAGTTRLSLRLRVSRNAARALARVRKIGVTVTAAAVAGTRTRSVSKKITLTR
jgi:hypothetical protein